MAKKKLDVFTKSYIETAFWASTDEQTGLPMDGKYGAEDISPELMEEMIDDCAKFQSEHWDDISEDPVRAGHDFWLTRNHHGAGFWDGDWPKDVGARLTDAAHAYGERNLYVGDDGKIYAA